VLARLYASAFARLGGEPEPIARPANALLATTATLPPPLRHVRKDMPKTVASATGVPLKIMFPLDGSRVDLGATQLGGDTALLALKASGGVPPLRWLVNGAPVGGPELRRQGFWLPDGAGFAKVSVIDSRGTSDTVSVRLE
jgi:penicillin-binding protein 1C